MQKKPSFSASLPPSELAAADQGTALLDAMINQLVDICRDVLIKNPASDDLFLMLLVQRAFKQACIAQGEPQLADTMVPHMVSRLTVRLIRAEDRLKENEK